MGSTAKFLKSRTKSHFSEQFEELKFEDGKIEDEFDEYSESP
jgi:hypothetical protein